MSSTLTVETADLRAALTAVAGHASSFADDVVLRRVRIYLDEQNVTVGATNRYSVGLAVASVWDDADVDPEHAALDLTPIDVQQILAVFTGKAGSDGEVGDTVRIEVDKEECRLTDTGGLFEGKSLTLPRLPMHDGYPDLRRLLRVALERIGDEHETAAPVWTSPKLLTLFKAAGSAYGHPLILEPQGPGASIVLRCGESFVGLLMPHRPDDDQLARALDWREAWLRRLARLGDDLDAAERLLRAGHGVTTSWAEAVAERFDGQGVSVTIGEAVHDEHRVQLAAAVRLAAAEPVLTPAFVKRRCRVPIARARALLAQLVDERIVEVADYRDAAPSWRSRIGPDDLDLALDELGLADVPAQD